MGFYVRPWLVAVIYLSVLRAPGIRCQGVNFTFIPGDPGYGCSFRCDSKYCEGNPGCQITDSALQLIPNAQDNNSFVAVRYMRDEPVQLWNTSFLTFFLLRVSHTPGYPAWAIGDGITFLIAPNKTVPIGSEGGGVGLFQNGSDPTTGGPANGQDSRIVAVFFDTFENPGQPATPYVCLLVNNINPSPSAFAHLDTSTLPVDFVGNTFGVWVEYDDRSQSLEVSMLLVPASLQALGYNTLATNFRRNATSMFVHTLNLTARVDEYSYVGFSAATGAIVELNELFYWTFESPAPAPDPAPASAPTPADAPVVPAPEADSNKPALSKTSILAIAVTVAVSSVVIGAVLLCSWRAGFARRTDRGKSCLLDGTPRSFSYNELLRATDHFIETSLLGEGGFGKVFKGCLDDGRTVAVKRISDQSRQGEKEFMAEVTTIGRLRHRNLVSLLGWCRNVRKEELLLVYDYMPNGSLDHHLFPLLRTGSSGSRSDVLNRPVLSWDKRYSILQGVASALLYIHEDCQEAALKQCVLHRDIKCGNIMLDAEWNAKLGDFGLARHIQKDISAETASTVVGTRGYMAPEYLTNRKISVQADVYSFGVVVLEVVTGRKAFDWTQPPEQLVLVDWMRTLEDSGNNAKMEAADPALRKLFNVEQLLLLLRMGLLCTLDEPSHRPTMRQVVQSLAAASSSTVLPSSLPYFPPHITRPSPAGSTDASSSTSSHMLGRQSGSATTSSGY